MRLCSRMGLALAIATLPTVPALATVTYTFNSAISGTAFTYESAGYITTSRAVDASELTSPDPGITSVDFLPACDNGNLLRPCAEIDVTRFPTTNSFYFPAGALGANGTYDSIAAIAATLTVSGTAVPEPASAVLLASGLIGLGLLKRQCGARFENV